MLLNLGLNQLAPSLDPSLRKAPNIVASPQQPDVNIDALLNLSQSKYDGLKRVGDTDYYYGNNRMYTPTSFSGGKGAPSGMTSISGQNFVPVDADITGFNKSKAEGSDYYTYDPSMAYISANRPRAIPEPTPNVMSFLLPPLMNLQPAETSYGAGRFLNGGMPLNFGINPSPINTNRYTPTITPQDLSNIISLGNTRYDLSKAKGDVIQNDNRLTFGNPLDMFRTVIPNPLGRVGDNPDSRSSIIFGNPIEAAGYVAQNNFGLNND